MVTFIELSGWQPLREVMQISTGRCQGSQPRCCCPNHDVSEIYSPPRVVALAEEESLQGGWSLDLTQCNKEGKVWDFDLPEMRDEARRRLRQSKPRLLIGSPMCTAFSTLQRVNFYRQDPAMVRATLQRAIAQMEFVTELYWMQVNAGRYFLHEHLTGASSWRLQ